MLRRDFLRTLAAFAATASAGGVAVASARQQSIGSTLTGEGIRVPVGRVVTAYAPFDLTMIRGDDVQFFVCGLYRTQGAFWAPMIHGLDGQGPAVYGTVEHEDNGIWVRFDGNATRRLRPAPRPWHLACDNRVLLAGTATILPDDLWTAEEAVLGIVPQMHPLGIITRRGSYEVGFRAKLKADEPSLYDDRVASLVEHCRPVGAEILNRGQGCLVRFGHKGLL